MEDSGVLKLRCQAQHNLWGKRGKESLVAELLQSASSSFQLNNEQHYAELWMGTHPAAPSVVSVKGRKTSLSDILKAKPSLLGSDDASSDDGQLSFLLKVLSIDRALAVQVHPDKATAERLNLEKPHIYKDANHKPEMAIALTPFKAMCGIRPIKEIANFVEHIDALKHAIGSNRAIELINASLSDDSAFQLKAVKESFQALFSQDRDTTRRNIKNLFEEIKYKEAVKDDASLYLPQYLEKLHSEYPDDVGIFSIYFLNILELQPGDAIFIDSNVPHAYISGDCIECMACSHNVIRAGLSNKLCDIEAFCETANFKGQHPDSLKIAPVIAQRGTGVLEYSYHTDVPDFSISKIEARGTNNVTIHSMSTGSICFIEDGHGEVVNDSMKSSMRIIRGTALFIAANESISISLTSTNMTIYRAF